MAPRSRVRRLGPRQLRWNCPASWIPAAGRGREDGDPIAGLLGQGRAVDALEMGLAVHAPGYNVFVTGLEGTERHETLHKLLDRLPLGPAELRDHVYVHNFADPLRPRHLALPGGRGRAFQEAMAEWVRALRREIPRLLESDEQIRRRQQLVRRYREAEQQLYDRLSAEAEQAGLTLVEVEEEEEGASGRHDFYLRRGEELVSLEEVAELPPGERPSRARLRRLQAERDRLLDELPRVRRQARNLALRLIRELRSMDQDAVQGLVHDLTEDLEEELEAGGELQAWLQDCARHALRHLDLFRRGGSPTGEDEGLREEDLEAELGGGEREGLEVFEVNLVRHAEETTGFLRRLANGGLLGFELHPTPGNLFGTVEHRELQRGPSACHLAVRPGSLLAADGGFLVLDARDAIRESETWRGLKRTLQTGMLEVRTRETASHPATTGVRPEPIPLDLKVLLIGEGSLYEALHDSDPDFPLIFKVRAEFDDSVPLSKVQVGRLARAIRGQTAREGLPPFERSGLQALAERAVREAGRRNRLSARLSLLLDYAREAAFHARRLGRERVDREAVARAERSFRQQHSLEHEWHQRLTLEGVYELETEGRRTGAVNALTVVTLGPLGFGRPTRVSATVAAGEESYLCIEREVDLSGPIHTKGVLMLEAFLRGRFGRRRSLPIKVSLTFDQSYGPVDGDSASSTELYALLSALAGVPLRQDLAVTGAVDMRGNILSVGGVNEKIEGFFELCRARGLTGEQGVLIPASNVDDLMLEPEVVEAVEEGAFHILALHRVEEGLELLSGLPAGRPGPDGSHPPDSFFGRVEAALAAFEKALKHDDREAREGSEGERSAGDRNRGRGAGAG